MTRHFLDVDDLDVEGVGFGEVEILVVGGGIVLGLSEEGEEQRPDQRGVKCAHRNLRLVCPAGVDGNRDGSDAANQ